MTRVELIKLAKDCGKEGCNVNCPFKYHSIDTPSCMDGLILALAEELEKADKIITVGGGENYEVRNDG